MKSVARTLLIAVVALMGIFTDGFAGGKLPVKAKPGLAIPSPVYTPPDKLAGACNLTELSFEGASIEGQSDADPNRVALSLAFKFEPGPDYVLPNGTKRSSVVIRERMDIAFFRNWLAEGISGLAAQINANVPDSCSISRGGTNGTISNYNPVSFFITQGITKRQCTSFDQPCGLPETTCTGGDAGAVPSCSLPSCDFSGCHGGGCSGGRLPTAPTCTTTVKMCRAEQKVDIFSAEVRMDYALSLGVTGSPPGQRIEVQKTNTRNDVSTSQGEVSRLLNDVGLAGLVGLKVDAFENGLRDFINSVELVGASSTQLFPIPTSEFVYLPTVRRNQDVSWWTPGGGKPIGLRIYRDMALPTVLACKVRKCLEDSKAAKKLLVKSCSIA